MEDITIWKMLLIFVGAVFLVYLLSRVASWGVLQSMRKFKQNYGPKKRDKGDSNV